MEILMSHQIQHMQWLDKEKTTMLNYNVYHTLVPIL